MGSKGFIYKRKKCPHPWKNTIRIGAKQGDYRNKKEKCKRF